MSKNLLRRAFAVWTLGLVSLRSSRGRRASDCGQKCSTCLPQALDVSVGKIGDDKVDQLGWKSVMGAREAENLCQWPF